CPCRAAPARCARPPGPAAGTGRGSSPPTTPRRNRRPRPPSPRRPPGPGRNRPLRRPSRRGTLAALVAQEALELGRDLVAARDALEADDRRLGVDLGLELADHRRVLLAVGDDLVQAGAGGAGGL